MLQSRHGVGATITVVTIGAATTTVRDNMKGAVEAGAAPRPVQATTRSPRIRVCPVQAVDRAVARVLRVVPVLAVPTGPVRVVRGPART